MRFDVIIIGAGAAGMMCAIQSGQRGRSVLVIDHAAKIGKKIFISGGGRCNFTNINTKPESFVSQNPHFCKSALSRYSPSDFIALVKKHRIAFHEKKLGQLFCDGSAQNIIDMLIDECEEAGARFQLDCQVESIKKEDYFIIETNKGTFTSESLVVATGGLSIPQIGATGFGYDIARQFGLKIVETRPALDGFNFADEDTREMTELAGVSIDTVVSADGVSFRENILFTHTGLSGPASLQASLYCNPGKFISINLLPAFDAEEWLLEERLSGSKVELKNILSEELPKRFAEKFCKLYQHSVPISQLSEQKVVDFARRLHDWKIKPARTVGYKKAEVTRGGVDTNELSSKTMESKKVEGLYFIGEVVDVTGQLGGYNFQWAWASGYAAGQFV